MSKFYVENSGVISLLWLQELEAFAQVLDAPVRPVCAILGGAKVGGIWGWLVNGGDKGGWRQRGRIGSNDLFLLRGMGLMGWSYQSEYFLLLLLLMKNLGSRNMLGDGSVDIRWVTRSSWSRTCWTRFAGLRGDFTDVAERCSIHSEARWTSILNFNEVNAWLKKKVSSKSLIWYCICKLAHVLLLSVQRSHSQPPWDV